MDFHWPTIEYRDETMREGMQIESADISVDDKVRLLNALGETGLPRIVVGSFVSPRYTPQMAEIEDVLERFTPNPSVIYTALLVNRRSYERARRFCPPLTIEDDRPFLNAHLCDVFTRRNFNRSQAEEFASWPAIVEDAQRRGVTEAEIRVAAAWGSNFVGEFSLHQRNGHPRTRSRHVGRGRHPRHERRPARPHGMVSPPSRRGAASCRQDHVAPHSPASTSTCTTRAGWPSRPPTPPCGPSRPAIPLCSTARSGGIGGCPYCGTGRATGMMATEDLFHMLEGMGVQTGVDVAKLIDCAWLLEEIIGRPTFGAVSKAGPRPMSAETWFDPNMPFVETLDQAKHFKQGPESYEGGIYPWREPIRSPQRPDTIE